MKKSILNRFRLDGRVALITGAAQGIGLSFARTLCEAGARVALIDIKGEAVRSQAETLNGDGYEVIGIEADVTQKVQVEDTVNQVIQQWEQLDIAINNAGVGGWANAETMSEDHWDRIFSVNLKAMMLCAQAESAVMIPRGYGKMINVCSVAAHVVLRPQNQAAYNTSKAGVFHLTRTLAGEWAKYGIRVNSISPGYTRTEMLDQLMETPEGRDLLPLWLENTPLGRLASLDDLQGAILFLASEVSDFITGHDLVIDGGYSVW